MGLLDFVYAASTAARMAKEAAPLVVAVQRARDGDEAAAAYLRTEGWRQALDVLHPGAGDVARAGLLDVRQAIDGLLGGRVVDAEYRVLHRRAPWHRAAAFVRGLEWGAVPILGPKGSGKTQLAMRLAEIVHRRQGYKVEGLNLYPEDSLPYLTPLTLEDLADRLRVVQDYMARWNEMLADQEPGTAVVLPPVPGSVTRRVVVVDEASLTFGSSAQDRGRRLVRGLVAQARHLRSVVVYVGQMCQMLPLDLLNAEMVCVKRPIGDEALTDRQVPRVKQLWTKATEAFSVLREHEGWPYFPVEQAWFYATIPDAGDGHRFEGLVPFHMAGTAPAGEDGAEDVVEGEWEEVEG